MSSKYLSVARSLVNYRILCYTALLVLHSLYEALYSVLSSWTNQCSLLSCKHPFMLLNFSPKFVNRNRVFRPNNLHPSKHQCIISLYPDHIFLFNWLYSKTLRTNAEYLPFAPNDKPLMVNKATKTSEFTPSTPDHCNNNVNCTVFISYCVTKITKFFHNLKRLTI